MTSEKLYSKDLLAYIEKYKSSYITPLAGYKLQQNIPAQLVDILKIDELVSKKLREVQSVNVPAATFNPNESISRHFDELDKQSAAEIKDIKKWAEDEKDRRVDQYIEDSKAAEEYNQDLIRPLQDEHHKLLEYKDKLKHVFDYYEITPLSIGISDNLTREEFTSLIRESLSICAKYSSDKKDYFTKCTDFIFNRGNLIFTACILLVATILAYFALPFLSIPVFVIMANSIHNMYKDQEKLKVACALMAQIDYNRFIPEEEFQTVAEPVNDDVDAELQERLSKVHDYTADRSRALNEAAQDAAEIEKVCGEATTYVKGEYSKIIADLQQYHNKLIEKKNELLKTYVPFPKGISDSLMMSHEYTLGREYGTIDVKATFPLNNIVFDASDRVAAINKMKLFLANALLSVRVKQLTIEIYDPKNMGGDFSEFITPETKEYIKINSMELSKLIEQYKKYAQENIIKLDKKTIDAYNKEAEEKELVPLDYKLLLLVSQFEDLDKSNSGSIFKEFVKFSAAQGVMIWILDTKQYPNTVWVTNEYRLTGNEIKYDTSIGREAVTTFSTALAKYKDKGIDYTVKFGNVYIPKEKWWTYDTIKGIKMPFGLENGDPTRGLNVAPELGDANVHALLGGATGAGKSAAINQLLISLITMYPPSELLIVYIDFKNVEAAKFTAGYDVQNNCWMDKAEEEKLRKAGEYYTRLSSIPHLKIISGTTDGEYALSVFDYLMKEMARRQELINKFGVTKIQSMREAILDKYNKEHGTPNGTWADMRKDWDWYKPNVYDVYGDLPRLLVIFDEFQVMFNPEFVDNKTIDQINGKITAFTKLARAMSAHFWFTSQSMKGTMSKDTMANFSLRGALRCTSDVSTELLGNPIAGTIKAKFGYMYTNDTAGQDKTANRLWRVPFLADGHKEGDEREFRDMFDYVDKVNELLEPNNEQSYMAEFYDEKMLVPAEVLNNWYVNYPDTFKDTHAFVLGERANYSTNKAPVTLSLMQDTNENVLVSAFDRDDLLNLTLTFIDNLKMCPSEDYTLIMNVQDAEAYTLMDVDNLVAEAFLPLASPKQNVAEFVDALQGMVNRRVEAGGPYKPVYVFLVEWERAEGIGNGNDYKMQEKFKALLREAPTVGVHFIVSIKDKMDLPRSLPAACNHRVAGLIPKDSYYFIEVSKVEKLPDHAKDAGIFAFYQFGTAVSKFRIYQHVYKNELKSREIVL